jgi:hypothetical protein
LILKPAVLNAFKPFLIPLVTLGFFLFLSFQNSIAQQADSTRKEKQEKADYSNLPKNPRKATILSAMLPGAGQVYNGKSWKVPIIYAGLITDIYFIGFNNSRYQVFKEALVASDNGDRTNFPTLNRDALVRNIDFWRGNRDLCYVLLGAIYALNLVDANVDAHLSGFDISDDLTLGIEPNFENFSGRSNSMGLSIKLKFK